MANRRKNHYSLTLTLLKEHQTESAIITAAKGVPNAIKLAHFIDMPDEAVAHRSRRNSGNMILNP